MRKKIPAGIIIFASLSSIITIVGAITCLAYSCSTYFRIPLFVFGLVYITTITFLVRLKNWARIAYIRIHIILASFTLFTFLVIGTIVPLYVFVSGRKGIVGLLIFLLPFSYFIISIIYFKRSDTAKLFKQ